MLFEDVAQPSFFLGANFVESDEIAVNHFIGFAAKNVGEAAGHAGAEIKAERAEDEDHAPGHVFAAMLADAFDDGESTAIANSKTFAGAACDEKLAGSGTIKNGVSGEHVAATRGSGTGGDGDSATGETFPHVIVGFACQRESDAIGEKRAKALAGGAVKFFGEFLHERMSLTAGSPAAH
jgi:hypothetical protein